MGTLQEPPYIAFNVLRTQARIHQRIITLIAQQIKVGGGDDAIADLIQLG